MLRSRVNSRLRVLGMALALVVGLASCPGGGTPQPPGSSTPPPPSPSTPPPVTGSCDNPTPNQLTPEAQKVKGYFVNACGQPIPGARVIVRNAFASTTDTPFTVVPKADGFYAQNLPPPSANASVFQAIGEVATTYEGTDYCLWVRPSDGSTSFASKDGAVQNLVWRVSGERPDSKPGNRQYYGGSLWLSPNLNDTVSAPPEAVLSIVLKPIAPLIDGSQGKDVLIQIPWGQRYQTSSTPELNGIPLGKYQVFAAIQFPNDPTLYKVFVNLDDGKNNPYAESAIGKFAGDRSGAALTCAGTPMMQIGLSFSQ